MAVKQAEILILELGCDGSRSREKRLRRVQSEFAKLAATAVCVE
jgi:hypothetical protein